ncbi:complement C1q-like protein 2 [Argopecten irradians]|uniref:complement C1q-like protein 2 n=1 Tax=Argopecten irradians TaxID=31199 RepID=UPI00371856B0
MEFEELKNIHEKDANALETLKVQYRNLEKRVETTETENKYLRKLHTRLESPTTGDLTLSNHTRDTRAGPTPAGPIAFYYYLHDQVPPPGNYIIKFDDKVTNEGGYYDPTSGAFTCPKTGVYVFSWSIGEVAHGHIYSELQKNEIETVAWAITGDTLYATSTSNTAILHLDTGDKVSVKVTSTGNRPTLWEKFSTFSGFLLE